MSLSAHRFVTRPLMLTAAIIVAACCSSWAFDQSLAAKDATAAATSWLALVDSFEYKLAKDARAGSPAKPVKETSPV